MRRKKHHASPIAPVLEHMEPRLLLSVAGRFVFYNNSSWDGNNASANANDDAAIATDKQALLQGGTSSFANYTSYCRGINGIMVDISNTAKPITATDFVFTVGNSSDPSTWTTAPAPVSVTERPGAGVGGSDRVTIIWGDNAIQNEWLQVTVRADENTNLRSDDVFFFGNAIGDSGNSTTDAIINASDVISARNNPHSPLNRAAITDHNDFNRDGLVDASDVVIARNNQTSPLTALKLIAPLAPKAFYVDPDYTGSTRDGSAAHPWKNLYNDGTAAWIAINAALAANNVTVYFSARQAGSDTDQPYTVHAIEPQRTDNTAHRLTLDGMDKYNTNDANPSWSDYTGGSKCYVNTGSNCFYWNRADSFQNYLTIKGFHGTGSSTFWGGDHFVFRDNTVSGALTQWNYAYYHTVGGGVDPCGRTCTDISFIDNDFHNPGGESLYIGGAGDTGLSGHNGILVEGNVFHDGGDAGGQGDGLDIKDNNLNVVVRENVVYDCHGGNGIVTMSGGLYYDNVIYGGTGGGFFMSTYWGSINGAQIYNNIVYDNAGSGIGVNIDASGDLLNVKVYNNTSAYNGIYAFNFYGNPAHIGTITVENNIGVMTSGYAMGKTGTWATFIEDHNDWFGTAGSYTGIGDLKVDPQFVGAAPYTADSFRLQSTSPVISKAITLTEFNTDFDGILRPQDSAWDMGAYEYH